MRLIKVATVLDQKFFLNINENTEVGTSSALLITMALCFMCRGKQHQQDWQQKYILLTKFLCKQSYFNSSLTHGAYKRNFV